MPAEGSYGHNGSAIAGVLSSVENLFGKEQDKVKMDTGNFLQVNKFEFNDWASQYNSFFFP